MMLRFGKVHCRDVGELKREDGETGVVFFFSPTACSRKGVGYETFEEEMEGTGDWRRRSMEDGVVGEA
jgi:hypothetical protein